jgi:hypothetical protein
LKKNGVQIGGEGIENMLVNMVLQKNHFFFKFKRYDFFCFFTSKWAKQIRVWNF